MSKSKKSEQKKPNRTGRSFALWLPTEVEAQLDEFIAASSPKPTKKAIILAALELFFANRKP